MIRTPRTVCLDCARLGGCTVADRVYAREGPEALLDYNCGNRWKNCSPTAFTARVDALETLGVHMALRGIINTPLPKEERVTRAEREAELKEMHRLDLRKLAIQKGFPHGKSLRAESEEMRNHILDAEFPEGSVGEEPAEEPEKETKKAPKKAATPRKKAAPKKETPEPTAKSDAPAAVDLGPVLDGLGQMGKVLDSHAGILEDQGSTLDTIHGRQTVLGRALYTIACMYLEPSDVDALGFEGAFPELFEEQDPS